MYGKESSEVIKGALAKGYTYLDGAQQYGNSESIGVALKESGVKRDSVYLLTKCGSRAYGLSETDHSRGGWSQE